MAQPTPYTRQFNFSDFQTSSPSDPLPATQVENELNTILSNLSGINTNIGLIQRDDGKLKNQSVHKSSFDTDSLALMGLSGFTVKGNWSGGTSYVLGDIVDYNSATYLATTGFSADSAFANDLNAGRWILLANAALANVGTSVDKFEGNGSTTQFNLTQTYTSTTEIMVFVNGALKNPTDDYTIAGSPSTLTLSSPPSAPSVSGNENVIVFGTSVTVMSAKQAAETASSNASGFATNSATSATKSENYAVKVDGVVPSTTDHSAKAWAIGGTGVTNTASKGASKEWATTTVGTVDGSEYSAKEYAQGVQQGSTGGSAKSWAQDANQVNGAGANDRSAKAWAQGSSMTGATLGGSAKDWAQHTGGTVDGTNYSAKYWATQANVGIVAGLQSEINTLAPIATDITNVAGDASDIGAVAGKATEIGRLGTTQAVADLLALGTTTNVQNMANLNATNVITHMANLNATNVISNINALNATGVIANIGTVAGISSDITDVKNNETNINAVKNNETNINAVATIDSDVTTVAGVASTITANLTAIQNASANATAVANTYDQFDDRYLGVKNSDPTLDNDGNALVAGALYFSNSTNTMKVYDGGSWISATSAGTTSLNIFKYVVSGSTQSIFSGSDSNNATLTYTVANIIVTLNGVVLDASDYTASNGTSIVLGTNAVTNDELVVYSFKSFEVANALSLATGGTVAGNSTFNGTLTVNNDATFQDNAKLKIGTGGDLILYHDGTNNIIRGTDKPTWIQSDGNVYITKNNASEYMALFLPDSFCQLNFDNSVKLRTSSTGVDVTGDLTATTLTGTLQTASQTNITSVGALNAGSITSGFGSIDTGSSDITTTGSISAGSIGATTVANISINSQASYLGNYRAIGWGGTANGTTHIYSQIGSVDDLVLHAGTGKDIVFETGGSTADRLRLDSDGNLGLGINAYFTTGTGFHLADNYKIGFGGGGNGRPDFQLGYDSSDDRLHLACGYGADTGDIQWTTGGQQQFRHSGANTALYFMDADNSNYGVCGFEPATYNGGVNRWYTQNSTDFAIAYGGQNGFYMKHSTRQVILSYGGQSTPGDNVRQLTIGYSLGNNKGGIYMPT